MKRTFSLCIWVILILASTELVLRLLGFSPHEQGDYTYRSEPGDSLIPDTLLASRLGQGTFTAFVQEKLTYRARHIRTGYDITRGIYDTLPLGLPRIDFHGCSFTYGMGVSDTQTYSYLYARAHKNWMVRNYGCPGYATLEALLILQRQKRQGDLPYAVIINYLDFHDERSAGSAVWREWLKEGVIIGGKRCLSKNEIDKISTARFPFAGLSGDTLDIRSYTIEDMYQPLWLRDYLALVYASEKGLNRLLFERDDQVVVTQTIFRRIKKFCAENNVKLIVSVMSQSKATDEMKKFLAAEHIRMVDISLDFSNLIYTNLPYDGHPSPLAHRLMAQKLMNIEPQ